MIDDAELQTRLKFVPGSFFEALPEGADVYLLKSILHNWDDEHCAHILATCHRAMPAHAKLFVIERLKVERPQRNVHDQAAARTDLNMLAGLGGRERTRAGYAKLLAQQGFCLVDIHTTPFEFSVLVAEPCAT